MSDARRARMCSVHGGACRADILKIESPCGFGQLPLKNPRKWQRVPTFGSVIYDIFLPMKLPFDEDRAQNHTLHAVKRHFPSVSHVIDLSHHCLSTYCDDVPGVRHTKLLLESKVVPSPADTDEFNRRVDRYRKESLAGLIAVHCHYSYNRTGFMIATYLIQRQGLSVDDALAAFAESRPPGIKHAWFVDELRARAGARVGGASGRGAGAVGTRTGSEPGTPASMPSVSGAGSMVEGVAGGAQGHGPSLPESTAADGGAAGAPSSLEAASTVGPRDSERLSPSVASSRPSSAEAPGVGGTAEATASHRGHRSAGKEARGQYRPRVTSDYMLALLAGETSPYSSGEGGIQDPDDRTGVFSDCLQRSVGAARGPRVAFGGGSRAAGESQKVLGAGGGVVWSSCDSDGSAYGGEHVKGTRSMGLPRQSTAGMSTALSSRRGSSSLEQEEESWGSGLEYAGWAPAPELEEQLPRDSGRERIYYQQAEAEAEGDGAAVATACAVGGGAEVAVGSEAGHEPVVESARSVGGKWLKTKLIGLHSIISLPIDRSTRLTAHPAEQALVTLQIRVEACSPRNHFSLRPGLPRVMNGNPISIDDAIFQFERSFNARGVIGALEVEAGARSRTDISAIRTMLVQNLTKLPILRQAGEAQISVLPRTVGLSKLEAGQVLFRHGDTGDRLYCVLVGQLGVFLKDDLEKPAGRKRRRKSLLVSEEGPDGPLGAPNPKQQAASEAAYADLANALGVQVVEKQDMQLKRHGSTGGFRESQESPQHARPEGLHSDVIQGMHLGAAQARRYARSSGDVLGTPQRPTSASARRSYGAVTRQNSRELDMGLAAGGGGGQRSRSGRARRGSVTGAVSLTLTEMQRMGAMVKTAGGQDENEHSGFGPAGDFHSASPSALATAAAALTPSRAGRLGGGMFAMVRQRALTKLKGHTLVGKISGGGTFGELALRSHDRTRTATIRALSHCLLMSIRRDDFNLHEPLRELLDISSERLLMFRRLEFLRRLSVAEVTEFMLGMHPIEVGPGDVILRRGQPSSGVVLLQTGTAEILIPRSRKENAREGKQRLRRASIGGPPALARLCEVGDGHVIGALPFLLDRPALLEYRARTACTVWEIGQTQLQVVAGKIKEDLYRVAFEDARLRARLVVRRGEEAKLAAGNEVLLPSEGLDDAVGFGSSIGAGPGLDSGQIHGKHRQLQPYPGYHSRRGSRSTSRRGSAAVVVDTDAANIHPGSAAALKQLETWRRTQPIRPGSSADSRASDMLRDGHAPHGPSAAVPKQAVSDLESAVGTIESPNSAIDVNDKGGSGMPRGIAAPPSVGDCTKRRGMGHRVKSTSQLLGRPGQRLAGMASGGVVGAREIAPAPAGSDCGQSEQDETSTNAPSTDCDDQSFLSRMQSNGTASSSRKLWRASSSPESIAIPSRATHQAGSSPAVATPEARIHDWAADLPSQPRRRAHTYAHDSPLQGFDASASGGGSPHRGKGRNSVGNVLATPEGRKQPLSGASSASQTYKLHGTPAVGSSPASQERSGGGPRHRRGSVDPQVMSRHVRRLSAAANPIAMAAMRAVQSIAPRSPEAHARRGSSGSGGSPGMARSVRMGSVGSRGSAGRSPSFRRRCPSSPSLLPELPGFVQETSFDLGESSYSETESDEDRTGRKRGDVDGNGAAVDGMVSDSGSEGDGDTSSDNSIPSLGPGGLGETMGDYSVQSARGTTGNHSERRMAVEGPQIAFGGNKQSDAPRGGSRAFKHASRGLKHSRQGQILHAAAHARKGRRGRRRRRRQSSSQASVATTGTSRSVLSHEAPPPEFLAFALGSPLLMPGLHRRPVAPVRGDTAGTESPRIGVTGLVGGGQGVKVGADGVPLQGVYASRAYRSTKVRVGQLRSDKLLGRHSARFVASPIRSNAAAYRAASVLIASGSHHWEDKRTRLGSSKADVAASRSKFLLCQQLRRDENERKVQHLPVISQQGPYRDKKFIRSQQRSQEVIDLLQDVVGGGRRKGPISRWQQDPLMAAAQKRRKDQHRALGAPSDTTTGLIDPRSHLDDPIGQQVASHSLMPRAVGFMRAMRGYT